MIRRMVSGGVTGLLGGIVGQFLGGGFKPIDLSTALASFGLALDIPPGGIRKLTSGTDDFLAVFANLSKAAGAAHEEADTRAVIVEKIVHPERDGPHRRSRELPEAARARRGHRDASHRAVVVDRRRHALGVDHVAATCSSIRTR